MSAAVTTIDSLPGPGYSVRVVSGRSCSPADCRGIATTSLRVPSLAAGLARSQVSRKEHVMAKVKGIQAHPVFKLGKAPAKKDDRNLLFAAVLRAVPKLPRSYDFDITHPGIPLPMFGNDVHGDCVMAGRAHQTLRFEDIEQGSVLMITDKDVLCEYFKETGGPDCGLVVLDSLKEWRRDGWKVGKRTYKIQAFAQVDGSYHDQVRQAIFADVGIGLGLELPKSCAAAGPDGTAVGSDLRSRCQARLVGRPLRLCPRLYPHGPGLCDMGPQATDVVGVARQVLRRGVRHLRRPGHIQEDCD